MSGDTTQRETNPLEVLRSMGIVATSVKRLKSTYNTHWLVRFEQSRLVLRRYWSGRNKAYAEYEIRLLERLNLAGWPVPVPRTDAVEIDGYVWCLFTHLEGRSSQPRTMAANSEGAALARKVARSVACGYGAVH